MSEWEIHVHVDDEETARNMMEELNGEGLGVTLYNREVITTAKMVLQYCLLSAKAKSHGETQAED